MDFCGQSLLPARRSPSWALWRLLACLLGHRESPAWGGEVGMGLIRAPASTKRFLC